MENQKNKRKIGLALGSGGIRGLAHIGVIKVLLENKIKIDCVSGSSIGSLVGAYFAAFGEVDSLEKIFLQEPSDFLPLFFDPSIKGGLVDGDKINNYLSGLLEDKDFSKTRIPFYINATDLLTGESVIFSSGKLVPAIRASISLPVIFKPYSYQERFLIDGGLSDPVPVKILKDNSADKVIAVNLYHQNELKNVKINISNTAISSTRIALYNLSKISVASAEAILNPDTSMCINKFTMIDFLKPENLRKIISLGEEEARRCLPEIKKMIS
jgi:NTE family protein